MTLPALAVTAGLVIALAGLWRHRRVVDMPLASRGSTLPLACALRAVLVGGALVAGGLGALAGSSAVVGLACVIGLEELLETSVVIAALRAQDVRLTGASQRGARTRGAA
jgi:hypothetical protein